jgi:hypothetical protein
MLWLPQFQWALFTSGHPVRGGARSDAPLGAVLSVAATLYSPAFAALAAGCALFLYISYAMPIAAGFLAEGKSWTEFGPFRLGIWRFKGPPIGAEIARRQAEIAEAEKAVGETG